MYYLPWDCCQMGKGLSYILLFKVWVKGIRLVQETPIGMILWPYHFWPVQHISNVMGVIVVKSVDHKFYYKASLVLL